MLKLPRKKVALIALGNEKKVGSLYIPDGSEGRIDNGVVKYVGPDCEYVSIGDHCVFSGWSGTQLDMDGEPTLIILDEDYITAIVKDTQELLVDDLFVRSVDNSIPFTNITYEEILNILASYAQQNKIETSKRKPHNTEKTDWRASAV